MGGGGRDPGRDVQQVGVRTVNLAPIAPENISTSTKIFQSLENISYLQSAGQRGSSTQPWVTTAPVASLSPWKYFRKLKNILNIYCEMSQYDVWGTRSSPAHIDLVVIMMEINIKASAKSNSHLSG